MMIFEKLKEYLNNEIVILEKKLKTIENNKNNYQGLAQIRLILDDTDNYQKIFNEELIDNSLSDNLKNKIDLFRELNNLISDFENDFFKIEDLNFERILSNMDISLEKQNELKAKLDTFKQLYPYINDSEYEDDTIKQMVHSGIEEIIIILKEQIKKMLDTIIQELREFYEQSILELNNLVSEADIITQKLNTIKYYNNLFTNDGPIILFKNEKLFNGFLDYLKNSSLEITTQIDIIVAISKYNLEYLSQIIKEKNSSIVDIVSDNLQSVSSQLANKVEENLGEIVVLENIVDILNDEEKEIFTKINEIISLHSNWVFEDTITMLNDDFSIDSRECLYYLNRKLDWNIVISDIKNNLIPNIKTNKTECFRVFRYICDCYNKEIIQEQRRGLLKELSDKIEKITIKEIEIINGYSINKDYYNWLVEQSEDNNADIYIEAVGKSLKWLRLGYFLVNKLMNYSDKLNNYIFNCEFNEDIVKELTDEFHELMEEYKKELEGKEVKTEDGVIENDNNLLIGDQNLVFLFEEQSEDLSDNLKDELLDTIRSSTNSSFRTLRSTNQLSILKYFTPTGKEEEHNYDTFKCYRFRGLADTRTGIIQFSICEENKEKIRKIYNLQQDYAILAILMPISVPRANHNAYKYLNGYIFKHKEEMEKMGRLFNDPNTPIEKLCEIIDQGITMRDEMIRKFQRTRGAR